MSFWKTDPYGGERKTAKCAPGCPCGWHTMCPVNKYYSASVVLSQFFGLLRRGITYSAFLGHCDIIYMICFILYSFLIPQDRLTQHFLLLMHLGEQHNIPVYPWLDVSERRGEERVCVNMVLSVQNLSLKAFQGFPYYRAFSNRIFSCFVLLAAQCHFCVFVQYAA